jgi:PAS domain S-box-containing protein
VVPVERKRFEAEQQKLVTLVENSSDFIAIATLEGQALFVNEAGQKLVGLDGINSVTLTKVSEYFMPEDRDYFQQNILPTVFQDGRWEGDFRFRHFKSFGAIAVHCNFFTIKDKQMQPIAIATVSRDITERFLRLEKERSQLLEREQAARIQAETANRLKDEFLATLSHELRSPLNAMLGWVQMLRRGTLDAASSQRALETIERNARVQNQLIEDLLDVSRIITGKLRLEVRPVSLVSVISAVIESP